MQEIFGKLVYDKLSEVVAPAHTALILVDMQNDFLAPEGNSARVEGRDVSEVPDVIHTLAGLLEEARRVGVLVVHLQNTTLPDGRSDSPAFLAAKARVAKNPLYTLDGTWGHEFVDDLAPVAGEVVVRKHRSSGFVNTDLDLILRANRIESVVVTGCITNGCVLATAQHARFNDYYTVVPEDCVWTWATEEMRDAALRMMDTVKSAEVAAEWACARAAS
jgi:nicotinamidase-related amidase